MDGQTKIAIRHLTREELGAILRIQTTLIRKIDEFMYRRGFIKLMPLITSKFTDPLGPDPNSSVIKTPYFEYYGEKLVLTQSMILHKQLAVSLIPEIEKIYIFSPNVRLERKERFSTGKHLFEFTQMDFEIRHAKMNDVFELVEDLVVETIKEIKKVSKGDLEILGRELRVPKKPFKRYTTHELEEIYGDDWEMKASLESKEPFWVICHKREFYDKEDPERPGHYLNYDLIWPEGFGEGLSGSEREYEYEKIIRKIRRNGLNEKQYEQYLKIAKAGLLKPSAGAGIGIERFVRYVTGRKHIIEIQPFIRAPGKPVIL